MELLVQPEQPFAGTQDTKKLPHDFASGNQAGYAVASCILFAVKRVDQARRGCFREGEGLGVRDNMYLWQRITASTQEAHASRRCLSLRRGCF